MNILFIGPYRQTDGWGLASQDYIKALNTTEHNISIKPIYMSNNITNTIDEELLTLENKRLTKYDCIIQQVLPHLFSHYTNIKYNILLCFFETYSMNIHPWFNYLININHIMVPSKQEKETLNKILLSTIVSNIGGPINTKTFKNFDKQYKPLSLPINGDFLFYFIGEYTQRKNLRKLIQAFYNEFDPTEPVNLLIKTNKTGFSQEKLNNQIIKDINTIKQASRKYNNINSYKPNIVFIDYFSDEEMLKLHTVGDCFVMPSKGEAFCRPAVEAMCIGNTPIITSGTGMDSFINSSTGYRVKSTKENIATLEPPIPNIYTAYEKWFQIDISDLQKTMRYVYENKNNDKHLAKQKNGKLELNKFSYEQIGKNISKALNEFNNQ